MAASQRRRPPHPVHPCHGHGRVHTGVEVTVPVAHIHTDHCGHYYHGNTVYHMQGHRHGPGCGHNWNGKLWVSVRF